MYEIVRQRYVFEEPVYTDSPENFITSRVRLFKAQSPDRNVLLIVPQLFEPLYFTPVEMRRIRYLFWGNLPARRSTPRIYSNEDLVMLYISLQQFELGQTYIEHVAKRLFGWGYFSPSIELVRKVVK